MLPKIEIPSEEGRLNALLAYHILDTAPSQRFDRTARLIADIMHVPFLLITFIDRNRIWRRATVGIPQAYVALDKSFAMHCLRQAGPVTIHNVPNDPRFADHPHVCNVPHFASYAGIPLRNAEGWILGVLGVWDEKPRVFSERELRMLSALGEMVVTELELHRALMLSEEVQQRLSTSESLFRGMFENASVGMTLTKLDGTWIAVNEKFADLVGAPTRQFMEMSIAEITHPDDLEEGRQLMSELICGGRESFTRQMRILRKDGKEHWVDVYAGINRDAAGRAINIIGIYVSIEERKQAEFTRNLLLGEISHRVKNMLAIVQGMARQMQRTVKTPDEFFAAFEQRLQSIAKSHDMITHADWKPLLIKDIIESELTNLADGFRDRICLSCPAIRLKAQASVVLGLVLHELMTNAIQYGALSCLEGTIIIDIELIDCSAQCVVELRWIEKCDLPIRSPVRRGFGSFMLDRGVRIGLSGEISMGFEPPGFSYSCRFPLY